MGYETYIHGNVRINPTIQTSIVDLINHEAKEAANSGNSHTHWQLRMN